VAVLAWGVACGAIDGGAVVVAFAGGVVAFAGVVVAFAGGVVALDAAIPAAAVAVCAGWAGADVGSLPGVAPGFGIEAAAILGAFRLELGGELYPDRHALVAKGSPFGGDVGLVAGYGGVCYNPLATPTFELGPCAEMELGRLHATGAGADHTTSGASLWAAPRAGVLFGVFPLSFLGLRVHAAAAFPLERPEFVLDNVPGRVVHQPGPVAGRLEWGVEARF